jgi:TonB family protein
MVRLFVVLFAIAASSSAQESKSLSPVVATSHLLKSAPPKYPAFAKAAGIVGTVRIQIGIYTDGKVHSVMVQSGPLALRDAATDCVVRNVYRPFTSDGKPVNVLTTVSIDFKLPAGAAKAYRRPHLVRADFDFLEKSKEQEQNSPALEEWLDNDYHNSASTYGCDDARNRAQVRVVPIAENRGSHLYIIDKVHSCACGATGNCPLDLVQENTTGIHMIAATSGSGVALHAHQGSRWPDVFFVSHMSAAEAAIIGFSNVGGYWGPLYCGGINFEKPENEQVSVSECN